MKIFGAGVKRKRERSESIDQIAEVRQNLPVYSYRKDLLQAIQKEDKVLLITASTGSGKSTQIPAYLLSSSHHRIAVTQPRRVAAISLAQRVAKEHASTVGALIGFRVRFEDCTSENTRLTYVTDGMLLREAMVDPLLRAYSTIFLDEAHERSLQTDILLGVVLHARKKRSGTPKQLQVVIMSATLKIDVFRDFFGHDHVHHMDIPGRTFPVQVLYTSEPVDDYVEAALSTILQIHAFEDQGDVLVFLPGRDEIEELALLLKNQLIEEERSQWTGDKVEVIGNSKQSLSSSQIVNKVLICLLYASLPPQAQLAAFEEKPAECTRKVILATNIAETSVTLPAIKYIVDTGKFKSRQMMPSGMESLRVENISKAQAAQRTGRAGRIEEGMCFRLYTETSYEALQEDILPEILRVNLAQVVLQLKGMGVEDPTEFDFLTKPDKTKIASAMKLLYALGAIDGKLTLTDYGKKLASLPLDPMFGHLLCQSPQFNCVSDMLTAVSVLSAENLFYRPSSREGEQKATMAHKRFCSHEGDLPTYLKVYNAWRNEAFFSPDQVRHKYTNKAARKNGKISHNDWCQRNYISGRSLSRAYHVRHQLESLCSKQLKMDVNTRDREGLDFLKCAAAGLFLQAATRIKVDDDDAGGSRGKSGYLSTSKGRYKTKIGNERVSIHPTSSLFSRHPAPACVVYTEVVTTTKAYIRGVTQIKEDWLAEVAPSFYKKS